MARAGLWEGDLLRFDTLPSTNTWALAHAAEIKHGDVVWTLDQTAGRGRMKRPWLSAAGKSLTLSVLIDKRAVGERDANVGQMAALAIHGTLAAYGIDAALKWPNDVMVGDRKIAGILLESTTDAESLVLGIGLNITMNKQDLADPRILQPATAMSIEKDAPFDLADVRARLCTELEAHIDAICKRGLGFLLDVWHAHDWLLDAQVVAVTPATTLRGRYLGLAKDGRIRVLDSHGTVHTLWAADIERIVE